MTNIKRLLILSALLLFSGKAYSYNSTMMNGDILEEGNYNLNLESQYITRTRTSGVNINARFDAPLNKSSNIRAILGLGHTDFHAGAYYKWIPIPDYDRQPALGLLAGVHYANLDNRNEFNLKVAPYMSKSFHLTTGRVTPYTSIPLSLNFAKGNTYVPIQLEIGTELRVKSIKKFSFLAEIGLNIKDSFSYFALGVSYNYSDLDGGLFFKQ